MACKKPGEEMDKKIFAEIYNTHCQGEMYGYHDPLL